MFCAGPWRFAAAGLFPSHARSAALEPLPSGDLPLVAQTGISAPLRVLRGREQTHPRWKTRTLNSLWKIVTFLSFFFLTVQSSPSLRKRLQNALCIYLLRIEKSKKLWDMTCCKAVVEGQRELGLPLLAKKCSLGCIRTCWSTHMIAVYPEVLSYSTLLLRR